MVSCDPHECVARVHRTDSHHASGNLLSDLPSADARSPQHHKLCTPGHLHGFMRSLRQRERIEAFVSKDSPFDVLVDAVRAVSRGGRYVDPTLAPMLLAPADDRLTGRELDILRHMGEGLQNKVIAYRLSLSEETVKSHVSAILRKMNAASRTEAVVQGMRSSLIS